MKITARIPLFNPERDWASHHGNDPLDIASATVVLDVLNRYPQDRN
ncbi:MAG: hypothetical protein ACR2PL_15750 [Dehalococcoidia bacterium]